MPLDRTRPYAEVIGLPGAAYEQDGVKYRFNGTVAEDVSPLTEEPPPYKGPEINPPSAPCIEMASPSSEEPRGDTLEIMHWKKLKVLVETYGGEWTNRENAIAFLGNK